MALHLPPQQDWDPDLLSELQRAVPILENSSLVLESVDPGRNHSACSSRRAQSEDGLGLDHCWNRSNGNRRSRNAPTVSSRTNSPSSTAFRWGGWVGGRHQNPLDDGQEVSVNPLADDALELPMSTLTSGRRRTYSNKSTFQAHVSCVMDPDQVPCVMSKLRSLPNLASAQYWPLAYRVCSPFDGQVREGCEDDGDSGAGDKMLGLLRRMGLENLLLVITHWDTGPPDRLGVELFRCVTQECKELLRDLQAVVREQFPPELLLNSHDRDLVDNTSNYGVSDAGSDNVFYENDYQCYHNCNLVYNGYFDFSDIGPSPTPELFWSARGTYTLPLVQTTTRDLEKSKRQHSSQRAAKAEEATALTERCGFRVQPCVLRSSQNRRHRKAAASTKPRHAVKSIEKSPIASTWTIEALSSKQEHELTALEKEVRVDRECLARRLQDLANARVLTRGSEATSNMPRVRSSLANSWRDSREIPDSQRGSTLKMAGTQTLSVRRGSQTPLRGDAVSAVSDTIFE